MEEKVPGGKLVRLTRNAHGRVVLSGDFFIYPEEGIRPLEDSLSGLTGGEPVEAVEAALFTVVRDNRLELIGLDVPVIAKLFKGAIRVESPGP